MWAFTLQLCSLRVMLTSTNSSVSMAKALPHLNQHSRESSGSVRVLFPRLRLLPCRFERLKETAFEYAFLLKTAGMLDVQPQPGSAATAADCSKVAAV